MPVRGVYVNVPAVVNDCPFTTLTNPVKPLIALVTKAVSAALLELSPGVAVGTCGDCVNVLTPVKVLLPAKEMPPRLVNAPPAVIYPVPPLPILNGKVAVGITDDIKSIQYPDARSEAHVPDVLAAAHI